MSENYVYIGEAWKNGELIKRIVHKNKYDAREDIQITTGSDNPDRIEVNKEKLYLGEDSEWHISR